MQKIVSMILVLFCVLVFFNCEKGNEELTTIATEVWESETEDGSGSIEWTIELKSDDSITIEGTWTHINSGATTTCPFSDGTVTVDGDSLTITVSGTANNPSAPTGYQNSPFELNVVGNTQVGNFTGTFKITFSGTGWPSEISGTTTATRTEGSGITI